MKFLQKAGNNSTGLYIAEAKTMVVFNKNEKGQLIADVKDKSAIAWLKNHGYTIVDATANTTTQQASVKIK